jgi:hypothetical protein
MILCVLIVAILITLNVSNSGCKGTNSDYNRFLKIGYHITLMLLRGGATVIATTRFPVDSALRFFKEDFIEWGHRLKIHGLDLRHIPSVDFLQFYRTKNTNVSIF